MPRTASAIGILLHLPDLLSKHANHDQQTHGNRGGTAGWKASMSRGEAEEWIGDSVIKTDQLHVTRAANGPKIAKGGFSFKKENFGRNYGDAVYLTDDPAINEHYTSQFKGKPTANLTTKVKVENVVEYDVTDLPAHYGSGSTGFDAIIDRMPDTAAARSRYQELQQELEIHNTTVDAQAASMGESAGMDYRAKNKVYGTMPVAFNRLMAENDVHALRIVDRNGFRPRTGGNQLVVFDPKRVVVVSDA